MMCLLGAIEITNYTPLIMVTLSIEEEVEEEVEEIEEGENGYKKDRWRDPTGNPNRGNGQDNGVRP